MASKIIDDLKENIIETNEKCKEEIPATNLDSTILLNKQLDLIHPLEHQWSFWYLKNESGKNWQENLMKLATFNYVEEFWA